MPHLLGLAAFILDRHASWPLAAHVWCGRCGVRGDLRSWFGTGIWGALDRGGRDLSGGGAVWLKVKRISTSGHGIRMDGQMGGARRTVGGLFASSRCCSLYFCERGEKPLSGEVDVTVNKVVRQLRSRGSGAAPTDPCSLLPLAQSSSELRTLERLTDGCTV